MSFTRFRDDPDRIKKELQQATGTGRYVLNVPGPGDKPCYMMDPYMRAQKWGGNIMTNTVDIEAELFGLSRKLNRDAAHNNYKAYGATIASRENSRIEYPNCAPFIDQTRATHPAFELRDLEQDNWKMLHFDPQANVFMPFQNNLSTRILEKDHFVPSIPETTMETIYGGGAGAPNGVGDFRQFSGNALFSSERGK